MNHGERKTSQNAVDAEGNFLVESYYVAAFIVGDIMNDELDFEKPVYQQIFELYKEQLEKGAILSEQFFVQHEDEGIRNTAIDLLSDIYNVSDQWSNKWQIHIPKPDDPQVIDADVKGSLLNFKLRKLEKKIKEIDASIKESDEDEGIFILLQKKKSLTEIKKIICKELKQVVVK